MDVYVHCLVAFPVSPERWTAPALVSIETAYYLRNRGWWVLIDPADERLAEIHAVYLSDIRRRHE